MYFTTIVQQSLDEQFNTFHTQIQLENLNQK